MPGLKRPRRARTRVDRPPSRTAARRPTGPVGALAGIAADLLAIAVEMLAIPARAWMRVAEGAGRLVLGAARAAWPPLLAAWRAGLGLLRLTERVITPARMTAVVALGAAVMLAASQFVDYRAVSLGETQYRAVENVAGAPQVAARDPRSAHGAWLIVIALASVAVVAVSYGRRWRLSRLLLVLGAAAAAVTLLHDHHAGLEPGQAGVAYEGATPVLLAGYWAQLASAGILALCGPLLAFHLGAGRERRARGPARRRAAGRLGRRDGSSRPAGAPS